MACPDKQTLLRFVDDEVEPREQEQIRLHVGACGDCRAAIGEFRAIDASLGASSLSLDESAAGCFDSMALARYQSGALKDSEREKFEAHLALCAACVERLVELDSRMAEPLLKTPDLLLRAALGGEEKKEHGFFAALRRWFETAGIGRLSFAGAGACAIVLFAVFLAQHNLRQGTPPDPDDLIQRRGQRRQDIVVQTKLDLSDKLRTALSGYEPQHAATTSAPLLAILRELAPELALAEIKTIDIDGDLRRAILDKRDLPESAVVLLDKQGKLWIGAGS